MLEVKEEELNKILPSDGPSIDEVKRYLEKYNDEYIVIKCGGSVLVDQNLFNIFIKDITTLNKLGFIPIVVHGGGKRISNKLNELGIKSEFIKGLRVTGKETIEVVEQVLIEFNHEIVEALKNESCNSETINSKNNNIISVIKENDELVSAALVSEKDEILLVSKNGMSLRFGANEESIRSMGRSTSGVIGMKFRGKDQLLTMAAITDISSPKFVLTATDGGYAKRTPLDEYRPQGRGGLGVKAAKIDEDSRGVLVGAMIVEASDEILAITSGGVVIRTACAEIRETSRDTLGVRLVNLDEGISVVSITQVKE